MSTILTLLGVARAGLMKHWAWLALAAALAGGGWLALELADRRHKNALDTAATTGAAAGRAEAIAAGQRQTLDQLGDAKHAEDTLRRAAERSTARHDACLLDAREPAACERFRPLGEPDQLVPR